MKKIVFFVIFPLFLTMAFIISPLSAKAEGNSTYVEGGLEDFSTSPLLIDQGTDDFGNFAVVNPGDSVRYPNSTIVARAGDVLISDKSWDATRMVGHAAIVGSDLKVHEVLPSPAGRTVSLSTHLKNQNSGTVKIYRHPNATAASKAGIWAVNNVNKVTTYYFGTNLLTISPSYCSKFVYQAYKKNGYSIGTLSQTSVFGGEEKGYIYPNNLKTNLVYQGSYK